MPILKVKNNDGWQNISTSNTHSHNLSDILDLPLNLVNDIDLLKDKVGTESVASQINTAVKNIPASEYIHPYTHPADMITGLSDVAKSGDYNDLINTPTIPNTDNLATTDYVDEKVSSITDSITVEQVQADWNETDTDSPSYIKNKPTIPSDSTTSSPSSSVQSDWEQTDTTQPDFIKNKPFYGEQVLLSEVALSFMDQADGTDYRIAFIQRTFSIEPNAIYNIKVGSDELIASSVEVCSNDILYTVIGNAFKFLQAQGFDTVGYESTNVGDFAIIELGGEVYMIYDWSYDNHMGSAPVSITRMAKKIPKEVLPETATQVQADWDETNITSPSYIKNKPIISSDGTSSVQSNWNQNDSTKVDYIKNKPFYTCDDTVIIPQTEITFVKESEDSYSYTTENSDIASSLLTIKKLCECGKYIVSFDGIEYECKSFRMNLDGVMCVVICFETKYGCVMFLFNATYMTFLVKYYNKKVEAEQEKHTISIVQSGKVKKINKNYLPGEYFGFEKKKEYIVPQQDITFEYMEDELYGSPIYEFPIPAISSIDQITVTWDGTEYILRDYLPVSEDEFIFGNYLFLFTQDKTYDDTPFILFLVPNEFIMLHTFQQDASFTPTHNVSVSINMGELPTKIHSKFIDNVPYEKISDKPFFEIKSGDIILEDTRISPFNNFSEIEENALAYEGNLYQTIKHINMVEGVNYIITVDGDEGHGCECVYSEAENSLILETKDINIDIYGVMSNGYYITIVKKDNSFEGDIIKTNIPYPVTIKIYAKDDYVQTIDPKYIPQINDLPKVTAADAGKVLKVSPEGKWIVE